MPEGNPELQVVMVPWLAMGHAIPFFELSKRLARNGHHVSILTTAGIIRRLPPVPPPLSQLVDLVPCPLPVTENLPPSVECTLDLPSEDLRPFLIHAFFSFEQHLHDFLNDQSHPKPDWILFDIFSSGWVCNLADRHGVSSAYLDLINAAATCFFIDLNVPDTYEKFLVPSEWIPFPTNVVLRPFEARQIFSLTTKEAPSDNYENWWGTCSFIAIRSCNHFEPEWLDILRKRVDGVPIIPVGLLPPSFDEKDEKEETWLRITGWLDKREPESVVFAAFGSEAMLSSEQIEEIALGLEQSGVPFVWALRYGSTPAGFEERVRERGLVVKEWIPQPRLLAHPSVGGFLTHGGWNSIAEGLVNGVALVVLPIQFDQGLNARLLEEKGFGVEVVRDYEDGSFSGDAVARKLRWAMVEEEGKALREASRKGGERFGDKKLQDAYLQELVEFMLKNKKVQSNDLAS